MNTIRELFLALGQALLRGIKFWSNVFSPSGEPTAPDAETSDPVHAQAVQRLRDIYGIKIIESDPKGGVRPWRQDELNIVLETIHLLGPTFYAPFKQKPISIWIDRQPDGGHFGNGSLRIGEPNDDVSILYRVLLHEGTHASNEYRGWPYENEFCTKPGLDWHKDGEIWVHPRQQGKPPQPGEWETLPVDTNDVSVAPGEDLAEMVRYYVHSVKKERAWLWPLDQTKPARNLWDSSPTRFVYVRDHFLQLPEDHPWYHRLSPEQEKLAAEHLQ